MCELVEWELTHYDEEGTKPFIRDPHSWHKHLPGGPISNFGDHILTWDLEGTNLQTISTSFNHWMGQPEDEFVISLDLSWVSVPHNFQSIANELVIGGSGRLYEKSKRECVFKILWDTEAWAVLVAKSNGKREEWFSPSSAITHYVTLVPQRLHCINSKGASVSKKIKYSWGEQHLADLRHPLSREETGAKRKYL